MGLKPEHRFLNFPSNPSSKPHCTLSCSSQICVTCRFDKLDVIIRVFDKNASQERDERNGLGLPLEDPPVSIAQMYLYNVP